MSDDSRMNRRPAVAWWLVFVLLLAVIALGDLAAMYHSLLGGEHELAEKRRAEDRESAAVAQAQLQAEIEDLKRSAAQREAQIAAQVNELAQREAAIAGRENAATERTQSSFQGLLIQQQLTKNLEALKASLPELTPEVERLTREHAQFDAERQRLQKENAELRRKLNGTTPLEHR